MQHRINRPDLPHRPPHAFVAHPTRLRSPNKAPVPDRPTLRPEPDRASTTQFHATRSTTLARLPLPCQREDRDCTSVRSSEASGGLDPTTAFVVGPAGGGPLLWRHSNHQGSGCGHGRRGVVPEQPRRLCIGSRALFYGALPALLGESKCRHPLDGSATGAATPSAAICKRAEQADRPACGAAPPGQRRDGQER